MFNSKPELHSVTSTLVTIFLDVYVFVSSAAPFKFITILFNMTPSPPGCAKRRCTSPLRVPSSPAWSPFRWLRHDAAGCCHGVGQHLRHGGR